MLVTFFLVTLSMASQRFLLWPCRLVWTAAAVLAVHAVLVKRKQQQALGWHGKVGYLVVLICLALQYLSGGRSLSLTPRQRPNDHHDIVGKHVLVRAYIQAGLVLYALFALVLVTALIHKATTSYLVTAGLVALTTVGTLLGLTGSSLE